MKVLATEIIGKPKSIDVDISFDFLKEKIIEYCKLDGLPVSVELDNVSVGSFWAEGRECVVVYNSQYRKKYCYYVITTSKKYNRIFLEIYLSGKSKNNRDVLISKNYIENRRAGEAKIGEGLFKHIQNASTAKLQEEKIYYELLFDILCKAIDITIRHQLINTITPPKQERSRSNTAARQNSTVNRPNNPVSSHSQTASRPKSSSMPRNIYEGITINSKQAHTGCEQIIYLKHSNKRLSVTVPAGIKSGNILRLKGQGVAGGHLFLTVDIKK